MRRKGGFGAQRNNPSVRYGEQLPLHRGARYNRSLPS